MAAMRTPGITIDARGDLIIDKEYRGTRLFRRLGSVSQEEAEAVLRGEMLRLEAELDLRMHAPAGSPLRSAIPCPVGT